MGNNLLFRDFSDDEKRQIERAAAEAGQSVNQWGKEMLLLMANEPQVWQRYKLIAFGPGASFVEIVRTENGMNDPRPFYPVLASDQVVAFEEAIRLVKRNKSGDRQRAIRALGNAFDEVQERRLE